MLKSLVAVVSVSVAGAATAIPFTLEGGSASIHGISVGSSVQVTTVAGPQTFDLTVGGSPHVFDFLDVNVSGSGLVTGYIDAELAFSNPVATARGVLAGFSLILGWASTGSLGVLLDPGPIAFANGGLFDVDFFGFSDACVRCDSLSGTVRASVSLLRAPDAVSVPEPATLSLLGAGLVAIGVLRRRRREQV